MTVGFRALSAMYRMGARRGAFVLSIVILVLAVSNVTPRPGRFLPSQLGDSRIGKTRNSFPLARRCAGTRPS